MHVNLARSSYRLAERHAENAFVTRGHQTAVPLPSPIRQRCRFEVVTRRADFNKLEHEWTELFDRTGQGRQVFQSFHWLWHWCNHFMAADDRGQDLAIVTGRRGGKLVLVWPLVVQRAKGLKYLRWMGMPVSQYGDILFDPDGGDVGDLQASWDFITQTIAVDLVHLRKVRGDAIVSAFLRNKCGVPIARQQAPFLDLSQASSFDDYQKKYAAKARKNRRRLRRRVEERAPLSVTTHTVGAARGDLAGRAVELKRLWLKSRGLISTVIQDDRTRLFFRDAAASTSHPTGCRTTDLKIGSETAAIEVSFVSKGHCAVHVIVYHMDHEKAGAGVLLLEDSIRSAIDDGIKTFDLMAPGDGYKLDWADGSVAVEDWATALSPLGRTVQSLQVERIRCALKTAVEALPLSMRRLVHQSVALHLL